MTRIELRSLINKVRVRHNRRVLLTIASMMAVFWIGYSLASGLPYIPNEPLSPRNISFYAFEAATVALNIVGMIITFRRAKTDCYKYGVLCPKCGKNLYSRRRLLLGGPGVQETGGCPHCHAQLIDEK